MFAELALTPLENVSSKASLRFSLGMNILLSPSHVLIFIMK